ncbi:carboxymuconolactone decarboxylase family protein [Burkholderia sp. Ac-20365]|uniref:carboxymuconolactone decarboxylase family protein n=1 Tax=Burkholderia sp. Ac-20365 TaxID=2703897 RepID=UPI00197B1C56|nr:carboxymuconolactone decarboxylase family protein [Burkholderia sp. Ac-20365]MBN3759243.1 carboxymuconolactone decarboxylase family protein [Burkholderia sp. Ac-20365]
MSRIGIPSHRETIPSTLKSLFHLVSRRYGFVPDIYRILSISPTSLTGLIEMQTALSRTLDVRMRERISLAVSEVNKCEYCISEHSYLGHHFAKLIPEEIVLNRQGRSLDLKAEAAIKFAREVAVTRGKVKDADLDMIRAAGYSDAQIVEIIALCALSFMTNLLANVFDLHPDFSKMFDEPGPLSRADGFDGMPV